MADLRCAKKAKPPPAALPSSPYVSHGPRRVVGPRIPVGSPSADLKSIPSLTRLFCDRQTTMPDRRFPPPWSVEVRGVNRSLFLSISSLSRAAASRCRSMAPQLARRYQLLEAWPKH
jgi:hypothetical protein